MNFFAFSGLVNGIVSTVCGAVVYFQNPKSNKNRLFSLYCVSLSIWGYGYFAWQLSSNYHIALASAKVFMVGAIFIPVFHYHHILSMFDLETPGKRTILKVSYILSSIFLIANLFTEYFISAVEPRLFFSFWPVPGPLYAPYLLMLAILITLSIVFFTEYRVKQLPMVRNGLMWVTMATVVGWGCGATNFLLWYKVPIAPWPTIVVSFYVAINTLMFFRLGLFDIRLFFRNTTTHILTSIIVGGIYSVFVYFILESFPAVLFILLFSVIIPLVYQPLYAWVRGNINRTSLGKIDHYLGSIDQSMERIRETTYTYDDLAKNIVDAVMSTFPVEMVGVYFLDTESSEFYLRAQKGMKSDLAKDLKLNKSRLSIPEDDPFINYMMGRKEVVVKDFIKVSPQRREKDKEVIERLTQLEAEACVPFLFSSHVHGFLIIGKKRGNQLFHSDDIRGIFSYGRMGEEIMRYIMGMEHEVRHAALYSHDMNNDTKSLVQTIQFVRSPLGEMAQPEKVKKMLLQAEDVAVRLNQSFALNRDRSALILKSIKGEYEKIKVNIVLLISESTSKFMLRAEGMKIKFQVNVPVMPVYVEGNPDDLVRLIDNLLSNAFRYVIEGGAVSVIGALGGHGFEFSVADDGAGIPQEIIERIWDFGWQVKDSKQGASGLGLSIVKQIVQLHGGSIRVESDGNNKGTRFTVMIPTIETGNLIKAEGTNDHENAGG
jgi:signal transduction histidine kinase